MIEKIYTQKAPQPIGPYSQAIKSAGKLIFISGQIPIDPETGKLIEGGIKEQTERVIENIKSILESQSLSLKNIVKCEVFLKDISLFKEFNEVYSQYFKEIKPARTTVAVAGLPADALIEISAIAVYE